MKVVIKPILFFALLLVITHNAWSEAMIYKCKNTQGATIYKKAPCDADSDTVSTWTPKETKSVDVEQPADGQKKEEGTVLTLKQNPSKHYLTEGNVDGKPLIFVVDTGASYVSLPEKEAHDAQIYCDKNINMATANGNTSSCTAKAKTLQFGPFVVNDVDVIIAPNLSQPLLGMNVLQLFKIAQDNGEMKISMLGKGKEEQNKKDEQP